MSSDTGPGGAPQKTVAELLAMYGESGGGRRRRRRETEDPDEPVAVPEQGYAVSRELPSAGYGHDAPPAGFPDDPLSGGYGRAHSPDSSVREPPPRRFGPDELSGGYQREQPSGGYQPEPLSGGYQPEPLSGGYQRDQAANGYQPDQPSGGYQLDPPSGGYQYEQSSVGYQREQARTGWTQDAPPAGLSTDAPPIGPGRRARREAAAAQSAAGQSAAAGYAPAEPYRAPRAAAPPQAPPTAASGRFSLASPLQTPPVGTPPVPAQQPPAHHPSAPLVRPPRGSRGGAAPAREIPTDEFPRYVEPTPVTEERPKRRRNGVSRSAGTTALDPGPDTDAGDLPDSAPAPDARAQAKTRVSARAERSTRAAPPEDHFDDEGEPYPDFSATAPYVEPSASRAWLAMVAQWIAGAIGGAALWVVFRYLWQALPVVAIAAALLATAGLVLLVRAIRRSEDWQTTALAVLVGLAVTVSPAVLWLFGP